MALKRLQNTEKRLIRETTTGQEYGNIINDYVKKGYIKKVVPSTDTPPEGHTWYLPHFPVCHPDQVTTKTRIVFDASAEHNGRSLNSEILPGPKLQNDLFKILLHFRHYSIAIVCDIKEMYLQI